MKKIIAFGDSIIKGISYEDGRYYTNSHRFISILEERWNIQAENRGQMGSTISRLEKSIDRADKYLQDPEYDTVFLLYGGNDGDYDWQAISDDPAGTHICRTSPEQFTAEYLNGINRLKDYGKEIYLLSLPPIDANRYFEFVTKGRNRQAVYDWLNGDILHILNWHERFNLAVFQIGQSAGVRVLDISSCFLARRNYTGLLCEDGIHPNSEGYKLIADAVFTQIENRKICKSPVKM